MPLVARNSRCDDDPVELDKQHADPLGPLGHLDVEQLLDRQREHQLVEERRRVVHAGDVGGALDVGELLAGLLHAGVEVADDRLGAQDRLAVELEHEAQHAVGRGCCGPMLMIIVSSSDGLVGDVAELGGLGLATCAAPRRPRGSSSRGARPIARAAAPGAPSEVVDRAASMVSSVGVMRGVRRSPLNCTGMRADGVVLAQRVAVPVLGHEDAGEVGMAVERDAEQVEHLALHGLGARVARRTATGTVGSSAGHLHAQRGSARLRACDRRLTTTSKRSASTPSGSGAARRGRGSRPR